MYLILNKLHLKNYASDSDVSVPNLKKFLEKEQNKSREQMLCRRSSVRQNFMYSRVK